VGHVYALDHDREFAEQSRQAVAQHQLAAVVTVLHAPLREYTLHEEQWPWYDLGPLGDVGGIDLLVVDGPPGLLRPLARYPALPLLLARLSDRAIVVLDDGARADEQQLVRRWLAEFPTFRSEFHATEKGTFVLRREE
jgi:hypothetical protein